jgi:hypothetical protein
MIIIYPLSKNEGGVQGDSTEGATLLGAFGALEPWFPLKEGS